MNPIFNDLRETCCRANQQLPATGLVDLTFGNVSVRHPSEPVFAIKPSGVPYADLKPDQIVIVSLETGEVVEGTLRPSSDTPTHRCLFQSHFHRSDSSDAPTAIVHTHSRKAVAFAQAGREIPCLGTTHADYFHGPVPITRLLQPEEIASDYEWNTGRVILELIENLGYLPSGVLVRGHGPFAWGRSAEKAVENALALEIIAGLALDTLALNPLANPIPHALMDRHHFRKHGPGATYGQP